jgi:hypothetical protein
LRAAFEDDPWREPLPRYGYLKTDAAYREIDLHPDIAEFLQCYRIGDNCLLFRTERNTPHLYGNLEEHWLTPRLVKMKLDEEGMGWHSFKRFRKTWLRGRRCLGDINNFWMGHTPQTMSEMYSHLHEDLDMRLAEAEAVGHGFDLPNVVVAPSAPRKEAGKETVELQAKLQKQVAKVLVDVTGIEPVAPCLQSRGSSNSTHKASTSQLHA